MSEDAHRAVEAAVAEVTKVPGGQPHLTIPAEKWQAIENGIPHDDDYHFVAPRLAVFNGHSVEAESTLVHQNSSSDTSIGKSPQPTDSDTSRWTGWKGQILPFEREDGSCSLGMKFETGIITEGNSHPGFSQRRVCFRKTLADDQVIVLTGFPMTFDDGHFRRTVVTAKVRRFDHDPLPVSDNGAKTPNDFPAREFSDAVSEIDGRRQILQLGDFRVDIAPATDAGLQRIKAPYERQLFHERVSFHFCQSNQLGGLSPQPRLFALADQSSFRRNGDTLILDLTCNAMLFAGEFSGRVANVNADAIRLTVPLTKSSQGIRCEIRNAVVSFQRCLNLAAMSRGDDPEASVLRAGSIDLTFDRESMKVTNVSASKVGSLQPATKTSDSVPTEIRPLNLPVGNRIGSLWDRLSAEPSLRHLVTLKADNMSLIDVVTKLKTSTGLQFVIDSVELEQAGLTLKTPVTVELENVWLAEALRRILEPLGLGVLVHDHGEIQVTSARRMAGKLVAAAYPVADLVMPEIESFVVSVTAALAGITPQWRNTETIGQPSSLRVDKLVELISESIEPDSWHDNGGLGLIEFNESSRSLVVRQTQAIHEQIAGVLSQLRRLKDLSVSLQMHTCVVDQGFLEKAGVEVSFVQSSDPGSLSFAKLSRSDIEALRAAASWMPVPKVTLLNGQGCHLVLPTLADERFSLWPVVSTDRQFVRVSLSTRHDKDIPAGKRSVSALTLEDNAAFLVSLPQQNSDHPYFVIVQADIQAVEEEEELLGVEP